MKKEFWTELLRKIREQIKRLRKNPYAAKQNAKKRIKIPWAEIFVPVFIAAFVGFILAASFGKVLDNGSREKCERNISRIASEIEVRLENDGTGFWYDLINTGTSSAIMTSIKQKIGDAKLDISDYRTERGGDGLRIYCTKHDKIEQSVKTPAYVDTVLPERTLGKIKGIPVSGTGEYEINHILDASQPEKMVFANGDNLKLLFADLSVTLIGTNGKRQLTPGEYSIITGGFDMSVPGEKTIIIGYKNPDSWIGELNAAYSFSVTDSGDTA